MADITLSAAVRSNLLSLQQTTNLINRTQSRLSTGLAIESPVDDAIKYFQAKALSERGSDLNDRKNGIDQGVSSLTTALEAANSLEDLTKQIKGVIDSSRSGDDDQRKEFRLQVEELGKQIQKLVNDASYQGLNLLNSTASTLSVRFSEKVDSKLEVTGNDFNISAFFLNTAGSAAYTIAGASGTVLLTELGFEQKLSAFNFSIAASLATFNEQADLAVARLDKTISNLRAKAASLANNVAVLQVRLDFTKEYVDLLSGGAGKLTLADLNEEGANLLALQTRQQLGIQALAFAGQAEQGILGLFR
ncbi:MAG: flagellin N-terminal helical domain-containing protein [Alphaproteobacteria bacterium]